MKKSDEFFSFPRLDDHSKLEEILMNIFSSSRSDDLSEYEEA